ncbi:hypothetical protein FB45DRAFT_1075623 [Roridomyces roridus]|uniref:F-box domain-containing protein n=1 Tax=Roridomyces roridus TaxID=1738132 RepID=A0AAD7CIP3_9AGAR|nr:hypothetical protein FB45DRAFT_1075623 [Roridomyces roridus]
MSVLELEAQLEREKSLVQPQLNDLRDPMGRLPLEISSEIFLRCLPQYEATTTGMHLIHTLFLRICHTWADIALSTPALWTEIHLEFPQANGPRHIVDGWLQRAQARPLRVYLVGKIDKDVGAAVWKHRGDCSIYTSTTHLMNSRRCRAGTTLSAAPSPSPCLCSKHLGSLAEPISHAPESVDHALRLISAPCLEKLHTSLSTQNTFNDDLLPFLQRSSAPLQKLEISWSDLPLSEWRLEELVDTVHTLKHLGISYLHSNDAERWFSLLANSPSLLPNLCTLNLRIHTPPSPSESSWNTLIRAISARRGTLKVIHISAFTFFHTTSKMLDVSQETTAALRRLRAEGLDIRLSAPHMPDILE